VLLKERILSVHVRAIEQPIPVNDVFPVSLAYVQRVIILLVFQIVLVTRNILLRFFWSRWCCSFGSVLGICSTMVVVERSLEST